MTGTGALPGQLLPHSQSKNLQQQWCPGENGSSRNCDLCGVKCSQQDEHLRLNFRSIYSPSPDSQFQTQKDLAVKCSQDLSVDIDTQMPQWVDVHLIWSTVVSHSQSCLASEHSTQSSLHRKQSTWCSASFSPGVQWCAALRCGMVIVNIQWELGRAFPQRWKMLLQTQGWSKAQSKRGSILLNLDSCRNQELENGIS